MKLPVDCRLEVEKRIEDRIIQGEKRGYLGLSSIGKECPRSLWYDFRFCSKNEFTARLERLFSRGHREEPIIIADLEKIGVKVYTPAECKEMGYPIVKMENGEEQIELITGHGHIKGHPDGMAINLPDSPKTTHCLEFKTVKEEKTTKKAKNKHFDLLCEIGLEKYSPVYWAQIQCCMLLMGLTRTQFIAANKNDDRRHYERPHLNKTEAEDYIRRGETIIFNEIPSERVESYKCNWCNHKPICKEGAPPERNCRTCQSCDMEDEGKWSCSVVKHELLLRHQIWENLDDCRNYKLLNTLKN